MSVYNLLRGIGKKNPVTYNDKTIILFSYRAYSNTVNILSSQGIFIYLNIISIFKVEYGRCRDMPLRSNIKEQNDAQMQGE